MRKIKLKKKINPLSYYLVVILLLIISVIIAYSYIGKKINPKIEEYAKLKAKKIITVIITESINSEVTDKLDIDKLIITDKNQDGSITSIDFNSIMVNKILSEITSNLKSNLKKLEKGQIKDLNLDTNLFNVNNNKLKRGIIYEVPTGLIFNNGLLANLGPKIPVKLEFFGNILTDITTNIKDYGINNAIIEIGIKVKVTEQMILPFSSKQIEVETTIPIAIKLIQGSVPNYYSNGSNLGIMPSDN